MDLKNTINNTNTQKENIKTVANSIDSKLVELGGEQATDLSDVANKMGAMVTGNYKKIAILNINKVLWAMGEGTGSKNVDFKINFTPVHAFAEVETTHSVVRCKAVISNHYSAYSNNGDRTCISASITSLSETSCTIRESSGYGLKVLNLYLIG